MLRLIQSSHVEVHYCRCVPVGSSALSQTDIRSVSELDQPLPSASLQSEKLGPSFFQGKANSISIDALSQIILRLIHSGVPESKTRPYLRSTLDLYQTASAFTLFQSKQNRQTGIKKYEQNSRVQP